MTSQDMQFLVHAFEAILFFGWLFMFISCFAVGLNGKSIQIRLPFFSFTFGPDGAELFIGRK
jgi:hypothetical protein